MALRVLRRRSDARYVFTISRSQPRPGPPRPRLSVLLVLLATVVAAAFASLYTAQRAGAVVTSVGAHQFGVQPETGEAPVLNEPLSYGNGPVVHSTAPYALYWDNFPGQYRGSWEELI